MTQCSFCGKEIEKGTGKIYVKKEGKLLYFHNSKCEKNMLQLKHKPRKTKWSKGFVKGKK